MSIRDRIKDIRHVRAADLIPNERNWRQHPSYQRDAMAAILAEVGNVDVLKVVETPEGLVLIDGHLRRELMPDEEIQVAVLDLDEAEQAKMLATFDPLAAMAQTDMDVFTDLVSTVETDSDAIKALLEAVANGEREPMPELGPELDESIADGISLCECPTCGHEHHKTTQA